MEDRRSTTTSKVPAVTFGFWIVKILATTLGETCGDAVTMSMGLGYALGTLIFLAVFLLAVIAQVRAVAFTPGFYWMTIVATTTVGTTMADFADRSLGIGYAGGASLLLAGLLASLAVWRWSESGVSVEQVASPRAEGFYWTTILFSQTLGTALGDWMADTIGLGYGPSSLVFALAIAAAAALYRFTNISRVALFWIAFVLTRPLGATVGDFLDKPLNQGGLGFSRYAASLVLIVAMIALVVLLPQRAGSHSGAAKPTA